MKREEYKEMVKTSTGRSELHTLLLNEVTEKVTALTAAAPAQNRAKVEALFTKALDMLSRQGVAFIYDHFAGEHISTKEMIANLQSLLAGKFVDYTNGKEEVIR